MKPIDYTSEFVWAFYAEIADVNTVHIDHSIAHVFAIGFPEVYNTF